MEKYKAILFSPDGDFVTDFHSDNKDDVWNSVNNMGSKWIFYPIVFVATDKTIVDTIEGLEHLKGKRITTVRNHIKNVYEKNEQDVCDAINEGVPLHFLF